MMPRAPMEKKTYGQPNACVIQPVSGAKTTVAKYWDELKMADAVPRSAAGNHAATIRPLPGNDGASASPRRNRIEKSATTAALTGNHPTNPWRNVNSDQARMLTP